MRRPRSRPTRYQHRPKPSPARSTASGNPAEASAVQPGSKLWAIEHVIGNLAVLPFAVVQAPLEGAILDDDLAAQHSQARPRLHLAAFPRRVIGLMQVL